jgi:hypothetical protein
VPVTGAASLRGGYVSRLRPYLLLLRLPLG